MESSFYINSSSGVRLFVRKWLPEGVQQKGVLLIAHGMAEHSARYADFAKFLNEKGFVVYAPDHRGHGQTAGSLDKLGVLDNADGWYKALDDINNLHHKALKEHTKLPVFLLGHSMGSLLVRHYLQIYADMELSGAIVMATARNKEPLGTLGYGLAKCLSFISGKASPSKFMDSMSFGSFNNRFRPNRTAFDWLSRDADKVDEYIADPYCGNVHSLGFWVDFLGGIGRLSQRRSIRATSKELPMLFLAGDMDPVGDFGKGVAIVFDKYKKAKMNDIELQLYAGARHELLNELNRQEVYIKISDWIWSKIN